MMEQGAELFGSTYRRGEVVFRQGDTGDAMYIIQSGAVEVSQLSKGRETVIAILEKGAMVGEGAFIDSGPRSNDVIAMEPSRLLVLSAPKMEELILNNPLLAVKLMKRMLFIMSLRLRKAGDRISELL